VEPKEIKMEKPTTSVNSYDWGLTYTHSPDSSGTASSSSSDKSEDRESDEDDFATVGLLSKKNLSRDDVESQEIIDLTSPGTDSESHNPFDDSLILSPLPFESSQLRSPSRKGHFDESTVEMSQFSSDDSSDDGSVIARICTKSLEVGSSMRASLLYSNVVKFTNHSLIFMLSGTAKGLQHLADKLGALPEVTNATTIAERLAIDEKSGMFLTEAIMQLSETSCEVVAMQSRLLLANGLKNQELDPRCNAFRFRDRHFKLDYPVVEGFTRHLPTSSSSGQSVSSSPSTPSAGTDYGGFTGVRIVL
jgi:hypothetical protein